MLARLDALRAVVAAAEEDLLSCLVVTGEPRPQRVVDDWVDQAADTLRALGETAEDLGPVISRYAAPHESPQVAPHDTQEIRPGGQPLPAAGSPRGAGQHDGREQEGRS